MSGYPGGSGGGSDFDNLFAQMRQQQNKPINLEPSYGYYNNTAFFNQPSPSQQPHGYQQPSVSSPIPTPPVHNQQPHHSSAIVSPAETPQPRVAAANSAASNAGRTSSLLNLLKFSQPSSGSASQPAPIGTPLPPSREPSMTFGGSDAQGQLSGSIQGRGGSDLLAALMGAQQARPAQESAPKFTTNTQPAQGSFANANSPSADTQAYLLQLLNQPKPAQQPETTPRAKPAKVLTPPSKASSQDDVGELAQALEDASLDLNITGEPATEGMSFGKETSKAPAPKANPGLFTYVNPFEQLAASSPRNRTPKIATPGPSAASSSAPAIQILKNPRHESPEHKRKIDDLSNSSPMQKKRQGTTSQALSQPPTPLPDGRTPLEALIGIGAVGKKETVQDALQEVGDKVDKQVQEAIARAEQEDSQATIEQDLRDMLAAQTNQEFEKAASAAAKDLKEELDKEANSGALDSLPTPVAEAVREIIDDAAQGHIADSWESADAEDSPTKEEEENTVSVYNFPMKPWITITIKESGEPRPLFRREAVMDIARLKKDFDQIDRTLATASPNFIVYGMSKNGGVRIIRQDDGKDARIFTETHDRIFSVVTSTSEADLKEAIIGTGISGTVYWALIKDGEGDHLEDAIPENYGFALPPIHSHDSESPGGVLKTRARKSSAHPDFFAVGRGKFIHIIWPSVVFKQSYLKHGKDRLVDTDKYLNQLSLKINTGKAGKDFTFSEDDSCIVSLDKAGRVKFWDVRTLTKPEIIGNGSRSEHIEIKEPLITFITTPATDKAWPTSVLFVDKLRPYQKGGALRYLIVGMKQNHTLQLWDLALGKPVQEIHLPHGKESDAVCSVVYHAATGMICVGHPTRNSIYFLHLSAPKYNLPKNITQADYMQKLIANDPSIPKPDSTAVISGMREYSLEDHGNLRSLDILQATTITPVKGEAPTMFELYAMHSKGVTCLLIKQADLGWNLDNKVMDPISAEKAEVISIESLKEIQATLPTPEPTEPVAPQAPAPTQVVSRPAAKESSSKDIAKKSGHTESAGKAEDKKEPVLPNGGQPAAATTEKAEKKKRRKANSSSETPAGPSSAPQATLAAQSSKTIVLDPLSHARNGNASKAVRDNGNSRGPSQDLSDGALKNIENRVAGEVKKIFGDSFDSLYKNITDDRRTQAAVADAKQDAMLRLVSATLSDNIEQTLGRIVSTSIQKSVLPNISDVASKAVSEQLGSKLNSHIGQNLPKELNKALPDAIGRALQQPQLLKLMSESLAKSVAFRVEEHYTTLLQSVVVPAFTNLAVQTSQKVAADVQRQASDQIAAIEREREADSMKIDQLTAVVVNLGQTLTDMSAAQQSFQRTILELRDQVNQERRQTSQNSREASITSPSNAVTAPVEEKTPQEIEYDEMMKSISAAMNQGQFENAVIQWLQTRREQEFFANYFSKFNPSFVCNLSPLLLLSLGATITVDFDDPLLPQRITWLEMVVNTFYIRLINNDLEEQVRDLIPKIMGIYIQRLEHTFMRVSNVDVGNPCLKRLSLLVAAANRTLEEHTKTEGSVSGMSAGRQYQ
ncbi:hypothetical protein BGZ60DRAFT_434716 [Tricladium varicosporioides]|nr:hypothetical protein BGZ60DRAFT_434716 [Hymenoscyphus varicosporioides]